MNNYSVLGVKISDVSLKQCLEAIDAAIKSNSKIQICTTNNEFIVAAQKNSKFRDAINQSHISIADSTGVVWAVKRLFKAKITRIPGVDLFLEICRNAPQKQQRVFLLGGSKNVALKTKKILQRKFIGIHIVGSIDGIEINENIKNQELIATINRANANIIAVALGAPKQELWIKNNIETIKGNVFIGLGGTFDYIAGTIPRAPKIMRKVGLEWLFRLFTQPQRIRRILTAVVAFPLMVIFKSKHQY